ncbi:Lrp/AsnC family transcriptional regulator [Stakelama pacifica]|uniref:Lrp/AsnC family transcriptional regulator n=1 Tax=Stakelama pacifica TaxID=517720 RepID=A0A4R6FB02_9SPHN|nr:Lrp/AsnC family transcriptional regulator [Stakelama pacifica]TDN78242.1 Lrp/AsnC family transcriptional regulator [Stakelama pacifica]GGO99828.1 AsnC family transcriptional regulator [Stakelama pacifica]
MDRLDLKLLDALQRSPDLSTADLAEQIGLSHTPCWRRLKRLEASGAIRERAVILDPQILGFPISVFAEVRLRQHDEATLEAFEESVRCRDEIVECFSMSGERDYLLRVVVGDVASYESFLKKVLLHLPEVASINSSFALNIIKITTRLPLII